MKSNSRMAITVTQCSAVLENLVEKERKSANGKSIYSPSFHTIVKITGARPISLLQLAKFWKRVLTGS